VPHPLEIGLLQVVPSSIFTHHPQCSTFTMKFTTFFAAVAIASGALASPTSDIRSNDVLEKRADTRCSVPKGITRPCNYGPGANTGKRTSINSGHGIFGVRCVCPQDNYIWGWIPGWGCFTTVPSLLCDGKPGSKWPSCSHDQCY
jgi:hypothetical protein